MLPSDKGLDCRLEDNKEACGACGVDTADNTMVWTISNILLKEGRKQQAKECIRSRTESGQDSSLPLENLENPDALKQLKMLHMELNSRLRNASPDDPAMGMHNLLHGYAQSGSILATRLVTQVSLRETRVYLGHGLVLGYIRMSWPCIRMSSHHFDHGNLLSSSTSGMEGNSGQLNSQTASYYHLASSQSLSTVCETVRFLAMCDRSPARPYSDMIFLVTDFTILVQGFGAGHSSLTWMQANPKIFVHAFDLGKLA